MKLLYIANARIPTEKAHGLQIMATCHALAAAGAEVELLLPRRRNHIKDDPFEYYGIERNFKIRKIANVDLVGLVPILGFWIQAFSFAKLACFLALFKKVDIFYSRDWLPLWYLSFFKKNLIWEAHRGEKSFLVRRILKKAKKIVVITKSLQDLYLSMGASSDKILVARDGVDLEKFKVESEKLKIRKELKLPQDKKIAMYTGHLYDWKGAGVLLEAAKKFTLPQPLPSREGNSSPLRGEDKGGGENVLFVFVGGTEQDIVKFKEQTKGLDNILILGQKPHTEIPKYLAAADVLVLPNSGKQDISRYFTSPIKLFEYMAAGRPIVASNLPSISEVLNEDNAVLVEPDDPEGLARGINSVLEDEQSAKRIASQAFEDVKQYDWAVRARLILNFIATSLPPSPLAGGEEF